MSCVAQLQDLHLPEQLRNMVAIRRSSTQYMCIVLSIKLKKNHAHNMLAVLTYLNITHMHTACISCIYSRFYYA